MSRGGAIGFQQLKAQFIAKVDDRACNVVILTTPMGEVFEIEADVTVYGIPHLKLTKKEEISA